MVNNNRLHGSREKWKTRSIKATAAALGVLALAGCGREIAGQAVPERSAAATSTSISSETLAPPPATTEQTPAPTESIFEAMPPEVNRESWCGYKASQAAIHWLLNRIDDDGNSIGTYKTPDNQNYFVATKTPIGFTFSNMELHPTENLVVRGDMSVVSQATTPVRALDTASFLDEQGGTSGIRLSVAAFDLSYPEGDTRQGGTSDGQGDICFAAQEVVDATR